MPTHQYSCTECGHSFEQVQSFSEDSLTTCPACSGRLRKVFNAVGVVFKGSGFYRTDSRASTGDRDGASTGAKGAGGDGGGAGGDGGSTGPGTGGTAAPAASGGEPKQTKPATPKPASKGSSDAA